MSTIVPFLGPSRFVAFGRGFGFVPHGDEILYRHVVGQANFVVFEPNRKARCSAVADIRIL